MFTSFTNYWWICKKDPSHQFKCTPYYRCVMKQGMSSQNWSVEPVECPYCSNSKVSKTYNLQVIYPEVAKEWHPTKNGTLLPSEVMPSGRQKVWWQCKNNPEHEWMASIYNRISGTGMDSCEWSSIRLPHLCWRSSFEAPVGNGPLVVNPISRSLCWDGPFSIQIGRGYESSVFKIGKEFSLDMFQTSLFIYTTCFFQSVNV